MTTGGEAMNVPEAQERWATLHPVISLSRLVVQPQLCCQSDDQ
jgi:hypothetical protein